MTMPEHDTTPRIIDVAPDAMVSSDAWLQSAPVGGEDIHGRPAERALAVTVAGITQTRTVPSLAATANAYTLAANQVQRLIGATPQRRSITISLSADGYVGTEQNSLQAAQPAGLFLAAKTPVTIATAAEMWVVIPAGGVASYWANLDQG